MGVVLYAPSLALNAGEESQPLAGWENTTGRYRKRRVCRKESDLGQGIISLNGPLAGLYQR